MVVLSNQLSVQFGAFWCRSEHGDAVRRMFVHFDCYWVHVGAFRGLSGVIGCMLVLVGGLRR